MRKPMLTCAKCSHSAHAIDATMTTLIDKVAHLGLALAQDQGVVSCKHEPLSHGHAMKLTRRGWKPAGQATCV